MGKVGFLLLFLTAALAQADEAEPKCRVALVPGAFGSGTSSLFLKSEDYFKEYAEHFKRMSCEVFRIEFPPDATVEERALMLRDQIDRRSRRNPQNSRNVRNNEEAKSHDPGIWIIAHSQGGLDARFALQTLKLKGVRGLFSIGTPHQGTVLADWAIEQTSKKSFYYWLTRAAGYDLAALPFLGEMKSSFLKTHAERFSKVDGVRYVSARGRCLTHCHWGLRILKSLSGLPEGDGIVPWASQMWGEDLGEYDLDHIQEVGVDAKKRPVRQKLLDKLGQLITTDNSAAKPKQNR